MRGKEKRKRVCMVCHSISCSEWFILTIYAAIHSLQGALGKTSGRSYKAAPRQLLQVDAGAGASPTLSHATANLHISKSTVQQEGAAKEAAKLGRAALGLAAEVLTLHIHT